MSLSYPNVRVSYHIVYNVKFNIAGTVSKIQLSISFSLTVHYFDFLKSCFIGNPEKNQLLINFFLKGLDEKMTIIE